MEDTEFLDKLIDAVAGNCDTANLDKAGAHRDLIHVLASHGIGKPKRFTIQGEQATADLTSGRYAPSARRPLRFETVPGAFVGIDDVNVVVIAGQRFRREP